MNVQNFLTKFGLTQLDHESGFYSVENISNIEITASDGGSPASNCIYYALTKECPQNHLHWLMPDDHHVLIAGGPADYFIFHPDNSAERKTLGLEIEDDQRPIVVSPGGAFKAIRLRPEAEFLLVGSVVTPAWTPERVKFGAGQEFIDRFKENATWATEEFLKSLIGPNWIS